MRQPEQQAALSSKNEPKQTFASLKKTIDVTGPSFKDKRKQSKHNVLPSKSVKMETAMETKHLVLHEDASKDAFISYLNFNFNFLL